VSLEASPTLKARITEMRARAAASIDGFDRPEEAEEQINQICRAALTGPSGEALMDYIRSITTNVVLHHTASDAELRAMEGMRRLTGILDRRRNAKPKVRE
jgi:hypothetical protein